MKLPVSLLILLSVLLAGCVGVSVQRGDSTQAPARRSGTGQSAVQLLAVDVEFARMASEQGPAAAFARYSDSRSIRITPSGPNTVGAEAFQAELKDLPAGALQWTPRDADVSSSGDLGWTWGDFVVRGPNGERRGRYLTVWRWHAGRWWIAADIGTTAQP